MAEPTNIFKTDDAKSVRTVDGFDNFVSRLGLNNDNTLSAGFYTFNLLTRNRVQLEAAYRGSWIVGQMIDKIAEHMTKAGIDIQTSEADGDIPTIQAAISKLRISQSMCSAIKWGDLYGGCIGVYQIAGQDLATPLDISTVGRGQFKGMAVFDRWQLNPSLDEVITTGPGLGLPKYYDITTTASTGDPIMDQSSTGQIRVHHSRVMRHIGIELPFFQAITEMMWGESRLERLWDRLIAFDSATMSAANLIERANNRTIGIEDLREIVAAGGEAQKGLEAQLEMMRLAQTNEGLTIMDKNDTFATTSYSFAGLSDVMLQFGQQLAGAGNVPLVILFGQSPAGLSATGDSDIRNYYDSINARQETELREGWDKTLKILWRSVLGKPVPDDLEFSFVPLWQMSALDQATIAKSNAETIAGAVDAGLASVSTGMKELRDSSGDTGLFSNITDEEIASAEETESEDPPMPGDTPPVDPSKPEDPLKPENQDSKPYAAYIKIKKWVGL